VRLIRILTAVSLLLLVPLPVALRVEVLSSIGGLPPDIVGVYREPAVFQWVASGQYLVFDRRAHGVYGVDAASEPVSCNFGGRGSSLRPACSSRPPTG